MAFSLELRHLPSRMRLIAHIFPAEPRCAADLLPSLRHQRFDAIPRLARIGSGCEFAEHARTHNGMFGVIEIQGDQRETIAAALQQLGYKTKMAGG